MKNKLRYLVPAVMIAFTLQLSGPAIVHVSAVNAPTNLISDSPVEYPNLSWDGVVGATNYNVYRDGYTVTATTSNTEYTDMEAPEGTRSYSVTALLMA